MKLFNTLIMLLPSTLGVVASTYLCHEGKDWGWFLAATILMFVVGVAASMPNEKIKKGDAE